TPARIAFTFVREDGREESPGLALVAAFFACLRAGQVAVPAPLPRRHGGPHFVALLKDADPALVLGTREAAPALAALLGSGEKGDGGGTERWGRRRGHARAGARVRAERLARCGRGPDRHDAWFAEAGLDSLAAMPAALELEQRTGLAVNAELLYEFPTVAQLAGHIEARRDPRRGAEHGAAGRQADAGAGGDGVK
ncbi:acyl carrier protein, partial [Massilia sp. DD77]|uniref:acyl carrier protein n=1 Tax=Massilia sp. DD77 TaxID=3109349 RepID=UPI002FFF89BB